MKPELMSLSHARPLQDCFSRPTIRRLITVLLLILPLAVSAAPPAAAPKTPPGPPDEILFANGDRLTGKFLRSIDGNVVFHSDLAGDVTVPWNKVKEIHSGSKFVVLQKGFEPGHKKLPAHLPEGSLSVENEQIVLTPAAGQNTPPIPLKNVEFVIDQPTFDRELLHPPGFFSAWSGNATGGATIVTATQNSYTFNGAVALQRVEPDVSWIDARNRMTVDFQGSFGKVTQIGSPAVKTAIYHADAERDQYFSPRFYGLVQVAFDHNFSQSLDLQQIYGGGFGRTFIKKPNETLDVKATLQYESQSFLDATVGTNQNLIGSTFAANYMRKFAKGMVFTQQVGYIPAWNNSRAYSGNESDSLVLPVYKRIGFSVGTIDSYLNDPAITAPPTKRNSFQFTLGLTYSMPPSH